MGPKGGSESWAEREGTSVGVVECVTRSYYLFLMKSPGWYQGGLPS